MKNNSIVFVHRVALWVVMCAFALHTNVYSQAAATGELKIAFIADAHFHDVYARFSDSAFMGIPSAAGKNATIRTMQAQLTSTRLFNENYFALQAALDDLAGKGIKYVGLVGDFSDDGQAVHLRRLKELLNTYTRLGIRFFAIPGNHDPDYPVDTPGGKSDFMGEGGQEQPVFSTELKESRQAKSADELPAIYTRDITPMGYKGIVNAMGQYGFYPHKDDVYWATPYSTYSEEDYSYGQASKESGMDVRAYEICREGTGGKYKKGDYTDCRMVEDATYLVEPVDGLWLLAVDANVYTPATGGKWEGSGSAGYNKMITHKTQVVEWIATIARKAAEQGKTLVTFSHFPMVDFYDHSADVLEELFGNDKLDLRRMPTDETTRTMAGTGVQMNIAGHLHFNDTGIGRYGGDFLVNIQVPSLAAYVPAYKILTVKSKDVMEVETVEMKNVPGFNDLFGYYRMEHDFREKKRPADNWDERILTSGNYLEFTGWHLNELVRKRMFPQWPDELREMLQNMTGKDILVCTQLDTDIATADLEAICAGNTQGLSPEALKAWKRAAKKAQKIAKKNAVRPDDFAKWNGFELATDFYRMMNADELALKYMTSERLAEYSVIRKALENKTGGNERVNFYFGRLFECMYRFSNAEPCDRFLIDFTKKEVVDLQHQHNRMR